MQWAIFLDISDLQESILCSTLVTVCPRSANSSAPCPVLPGNTEGGLVGKRADNRPTQRPIHLKWEFMGELCNTFSNHTLDTLVHIYVEVIGARRNFSLK